MTSTSQSPTSSPNSSIHLPPRPLRALLRRTKIQVGPDFSFPDRCTNLHMQGQKSRSQAGRSTWEPLASVLYGSCIPSTTCMYRPTRASSMSHIANLHSSRHHGSETSKSLLFRQLLPRYAVVEYTPRSSGVFHRAATSSRGLAGRIWRSA